MIYFTGDTHGEQDRLGRSALRKLAPGDTLIICGDFGFIWDSSSKEQKFLDKLSHMSFNICFLDGTHENFELLNTYPLVRYCGGKAHRIRPNVFHLLRGQVFEIENKTLFTMGGGEPLGSMFAALIFGFAQALGIKVSSTGVDSNLVAPIPYIVTILALIIFALLQRRNEKKRHENALH